MHAPSQLSLICQHLLDENLAALANSPEGLKNEEVVHILRVATKRLRAAWKIVSDAVTPDFATTQKDGLRQLSALLAGDRDLAVLVQLATELDEKHPDADFLEVVSFLNKDADNNQSSDPTETVRSLIKQEKSGWDQVQFPSLAAEQRCFRAAIQKSRTKARAATKGALATSAPEVWHEWRKKVKKLRYQREFLAEIQNRAPGKFDARISRLGSRLGDRNDLANLTEVVVKMGNPPSLRKAIATEERQILISCRRLGRRNLVSR